MLWEVGMKRTGPSASARFATKGYQSVDTDGDGVTDGVTATPNTDALEAWDADMRARAEKAWKLLPNLSAAQRAAIKDPLANLDQLRQLSAGLPPLFAKRGNWLRIARGELSKELDRHEWAFFNAITEGRTPYAVDYRRVDAEPGPIVVPDGLFSPPAPGSSSPPWLPVAVGAGAVGLVLIAAAWKRSRKGRR